MADPHELDDGWSEAFGLGASRPGEADGPGADHLAGAADAHAVSAAFDFVPDDVPSEDDYDLSGDGVVDHHDVHAAFGGFHEFHADQHTHDPLDHHDLDHHDLDRHDDLVDHSVDHTADHHLDDTGAHGLHHDAHDLHGEGGELFGF